MSRPRIQWGRTPDGITPLVGYRCWTLSVRSGRGALHSLNGQIAHEVNLDDLLGQRADPWLVARCLRNYRHLKNVHDAPEERCSCGFYALKSLSTLGHLLPFATPRPMSLGYGAEPEATTLHVAGRVDLAGKVVEHDLGYRAERMRIGELRPFAGTEEAVTSFARRLGVPVGESISDRDSLAGDTFVPRGSVERHLAAILRKLALIGDADPAQCDRADTRSHE